MKNYRPDIEGFFLVINRDWIDNETIDIILRHIKKNLKKIIDEKAIEDVKKNMSLLERLKQKESAERDLEQNELDELLD